ncbi:MAG: transcription elongation factor GreA [bacterium]|nr:transcription elongation factor GreA [bacterium]
MTRVYLTRERLVELKNELVDLKTNARKEISERLKQAKEMGDLSENSEFTSAREDQVLLEHRIGQLEEMIREAALIHKPSQSDTVKIGSTIKVQKGNQFFTYTIVGPEDSKPGKGLISNESPLGKAFLGKKSDDIVKAQTPVGLAEYKIIKIG